MPSFRKGLLIATLLLVPCAAWAMTDFSRVRIGVTHRRELEAMLGKPLSEPFPGSVYTYPVSHYLVSRAEVTFNANGRVESLALPVRPGVSQKVASEMFHLGSQPQVTGSIAGDHVEIYAAQGALVQYAGSGVNADVVKITFVDGVLLDVVRPAARVTYGSAYVFGLGMDIEQGKEGVAVTKVYPRSPARDADLLDGDVITEFDGKLMNNAGDAAAFRQVLRTYPTGVPIDMYIKRNGQVQWRQIALRALTQEEEYSQFCSQLEDSSSAPGFLFPLRDRCVLPFSSETRLRDDLYPLELGQRRLFDAYASFKNSNDLAARESFLKALLPASLFVDDRQGMFPAPIASVSERAWDVVKGYSVYAAAVGDWLTSRDTLLRVVDARPRDYVASMMLAYACEKTVAEQMAVTYYRIAQSLTDDHAARAFVEQRLRALHVTIE